MPVNKLILGDNLEILKTLGADSIDLIYLDPPFFSNRNYEVIWGDTGEIRSFQDRWAGGMSHYIDWLKERVEEMYRILKPTGSIFLHCDWHADAYIRVYILDRIFGEKNFVNEIVWCYSIGGKSKKAFGKKHDSIFFYSKSNGYAFNEKAASIARKPNSHMKTATDSDGRIYQEKVDKKTGKSYKYYLDEGKIAEDYWTDIETLNREDKERIGYPTQKPEALLQRIIECASNEGDVVLDPFVGGGTTIAVANRLNRHWIGVDQSVQAIKVTEFRLQKQTDLFTAPYTMQLYKYDYDTLRYKDAFEFESWIITHYGGNPQNKKGGDKGIDGKGQDGTPIQVKRSDNIGVNVIKNFSVSAKQYDKSLFEKNMAAKKPVGAIIAFSFGKGAIEEAARLKNEENIIIKLVRVEEIVPIALKPAIAVHINEGEKDGKGCRRIEFTAIGESPAGIEFYTWDFLYDAGKGFKPQILLDREGVQSYMFQIGAHTIAVKVVDNDGLENTEVITLKINGAVERE